MQPIPTVFADRGTLDEKSPDSSVAHRNWATRILQTAWQCV